MTIHLEWSGKPKNVERLVLPFQIVETINESRATRERDTDTLFGANQDLGSMMVRNMLIWGDNKLVTSSLLKEHAGSIRLVYIDPPFDTGADFSFRVRLGDTNVAKLPSILEEHAYRDTWGGGRSSYLSMMYERLLLIYELLAHDGSLYLHCAPTVSHYLKLVCDEVFGPDHFRGEIVWKRSSAHSDTKQGRALPGSIHDVLLFYTKTDRWVWNPVHTKYDETYVEQRFVHKEPDGRRYKDADLTAAKPGGDTSFGWHVKAPKGTTTWTGDPEGEWRTPRPGWDYKEIPPPSGRYWAYSRQNFQTFHDQELLYYTSKGTPRLKQYADELEGVSLQDVWTDIPPVNSQAIERTGYDTQKPLALLERIILTSSNPGDIVADVFCGSGTTLVAAEKLGRRWIGCDLGRFAIHTTRKRLLNIPDCKPFDIKNLGVYERQRWQETTGSDAVRGYLDTILAFYQAEPVDGFSYLHGRKADRLVHVGATDAPITIDEAEDVMDEMADNGIQACDLLGWEWEMGLHDTITEQARRRGLSLRPLQIPREVMERRITESDAVRFFELAFVDLEVRRQHREACVVLSDFIIPSEDLIPARVREQMSGWSDLIDYWSVDFDYRDDTFHNQWQAYRTREEAKLAIQSSWHTYPEAGRYSIVVKVIDIFGNDTTKLAEVHIK